MIAYIYKYEHINFIYVFIWKYMGLHILQTKSYIVIYVGICDFISANGVYIWAYMEVYVSPYSQKRTIYGQIGCIWNSICAKRTHTYTLGCPKIPFVELHETLLKIMKEGVDDTILAKF